MRALLLLLHVLPHSPICLTFSYPLQYNSSFAAAVGRLERRLPQALIIGVKKCGTRALLEFLRLNDAIRAPAAEIHFFDRNYEKGVDWYRSQMPPTTPEQVVLEKTPSYFVNKMAPTRVRQCNPAMKLIVVLRDPTIRAISDYAQIASKQQKRHMMMPTFEDMAIGNGSAHWRRFDKSSQVDGLNVAWSAIRTGLYHRFLCKWLDVFNLTQFHFVDGENLIANPATEVAMVERFLGLPERVRETDFATDPLKRFPCVVDHRLPQALRCLGKTKGRTHPLVDPSILDRLRRFYHKNDERLFALLKRRFSWQL